jgi:hypothetical protein
MSAQVDESGAVAFVVGMRLNQIWRFWLWLPVLLSMPAMLTELTKNRELGLIGRPRTFVSGRTVMVQQYWISFAALEAYARSSGSRHLPAWRAFNRRSRDNRAVGIFHETYLLSPTSVEVMYVNMPSFGLGAAIGVTPANRVGNGARDRLGLDAAANQES